MENALQTELDKEIKSLTASEAPKLTWRQRLATWWALNRMPKGQRMWALGFKPVNDAALRERMAIDAINKAAMRKDCEKLLRKESTPRQYDEVRIYDMDVHASIGRFSFWYEDKVPKAGLYPKGFCHGTMSSNMEAVVKIVPLSKYIGERIPERCMKDIARAKAWGLGKIYVAYPALQEVPQKDPVVLAKWDGPMGKSDSTYLEISWWE